MRFIGFTFAFLFALSSFVIGQGLDYINIPEGFKIEVFASNVENARSITYAGDGIYFVGSRRAGNVYAVIDKDQDFKADTTVVIDEGLSMPVGVAFKDGDLYVAEVHQILIYKDIKKNLYKQPNPLPLQPKFPNDRSHGWKVINFGPDGMLYVPVGAPCNVCKKKEEIYATITRMNPKTGFREIYASGIRNSVGFDWHPQTGELWFTDNGRDMMGDNMPPDELNHASSKGMHFGFPFCHGGIYPDPEFGKEEQCANFVEPARQLGPHVAALGMKFYTGKMFPKEYHNQIFIAEHGSWNRSEPIGYRITLVKLEGNRVVDYDVFADGWLQNDGTVKGRPNAILVLEDGSMLVSDDKFGKIYRITYSNQ